MDSLVWHTGYDNLMCGLKSRSAVSVGKTFLFQFRRGRFVRMAVPLFSIKKIEP